jgi:hypothetical protein
MYAMDKSKMEEMFNIASLTLAEKGYISPMYFIVKDDQLSPLVGAPGIEMEDLATAAVNFAHEFDADAIVLICEQVMVQFHKDDPRLQQYMDGTYEVKQSDERSEYLTLIHMMKDGEADSLIAKVITSLNGIRYVKESQWINETMTTMITPWV